MDESSKLLLTVEIPTVTVLLGILVNNRQLDQLDRHVNQQIAVLCSEMNGQISALRSEMNGQITALRNEMIARLECVEGVLDSRLKQVEEIRTTRRPFKPRCLCSSAGEPRLSASRRIEALQVSDMDAAPTRQYKQQRRLRKVGCQIPPKLTYCAIDFTPDKLADVLQAAGIRSNQKTLYIWGGVSMNLTQQDVR